MLDSHALFIGDTNGRPSVVGAQVTLFLTLLILYLATCVLTNIALAVTTYRLEAPVVELKGLRIVQLSDIHGRTFGPGAKRLLRRVRRLAPDFVVITGDLVSRSQTSWTRQIATAGALAAEGPVYYVSGNHESTRPDRGRIADALREAGVTVLMDEWASWSGRGAPVAILGIEDTAFRTGFASYEPRIRALADAAGGAPLKVLLSHRPQLPRTYSRSGADLVFAGHAHGGQINLPGLGPLYSPDEGLWPSYASGVYRLAVSEASDRPSTLIVSRGLGGSWLVPRIFNRPEIVLVELF